jgi:hypothetical protein
MSWKACRRSSTQGRMAGTETDPCPSSTLTHKLVPHPVMVEALVEILRFRHIGVVIEEYAVPFDGRKMFWCA